MRAKRRSGVSLLVEGAAVGLVATQALDSVSTWLYEREARSARAAEDEARAGLHVYERAIDQLTMKFRRPLERPELQKWGWRLHKAFAWSAGIGYVALRRRYPQVGAGLGLAFGAAFFVLVDELMMPLVGWSPGPRAFSWKVHARGAVSHVAYGVAAEATARAIDRLAA